MPFDSLQKALGRQTQGKGEPYDGDPAPAPYFAILTVRTCPCCGAESRPEGWFRKAAEEGMGGPHSTGGVRVRVLVEVDHER